LTSLLLDERIRAVALVLLVVSPFFSTAWALISSILVLSLTLYQTFYLYL
jgi:hypothetical protein